MQRGAYHGCLRPWVQATGAEESQAREEEEISKEENRTDKEDSGDLEREEAGLEDDEEEEVEVEEEMDADSLSGASSEMGHRNASWREKERHAVQAKADLEKVKQAGAHRNVQFHAEALAVDAELEAATAEAEMLDAKDSLPLKQGTSRSRIMFEGVGSERALEGGTVEEVAVASEEEDNEEQVVQRSLKKRQKRQAHVVSTRPDMLFTA